jgi:diguanylate cyclase (GGDEF)-like protein
MAAMRETSSEQGVAEWRRLTGPHGFFCTVVEGPDFGRVFALEKGETVVGRGDEADLQVSDEKVSRKHFRIDLVHDSGTPEETPHAWVRDLGSKNGVRVNGQRVNDHELRNGDKLKVGDTILKFEIKDRLDLRYHENLYVQATRDALTGLFNHTYFLAEARKLAGLAARYNRVFSTVMLDVDGFGRVNEEHGHEVGDRVLRAVGGVVVRELRSLDVAAREGGEKFGVLLPETPLGGALSVAERLRHAIASCELDAFGCARRVTVSIGVSEFPASAAELEKLLQRAEDALYQAKRSGRNRVCVARLAAADSWVDGDDTKVR